MKGDEQEKRADSATLADQWICVGMLPMWLCVRTGSNKGWFQLDDGFAVSEKILCQA